jgi:magnesium-transporting ATPase (P-type)
MATLHEGDVEAGAPPSLHTARTVGPSTLTESAGVGLHAGHDNASTPRSGSSGGRATQRLLFIKGAADVIVRACSHVECDRDGGAPLPLDRSRWEAVVTEFAAQGLRVLALAHAHVSSDKSDITVADVTGGEPHLTLRCLVAIVDPPRDEAITAVRDALTAGITVKMITGDHAQTALTIASWLGIASEGAMTGQVCRTPRQHAHPPAHPLVDPLGVCGAFHVPPPPPPPPPPRGPPPLGN